MKSIKTLWWALCGLCLFGCSLMGPPVHQRAYLFDEPHVDKQKKPIVDTLLIQSVDVKPAFSGQQFVYRLSNLQYAKDYDQIFFVPLEQQLTSILLSAMRQSGVAKQVVRFGSFIQKGLFMKTYVDAFYIEKDQGQSWAVIHWNMHLYLRERLKQKLLHVYRYVQRIPLKGRPAIDTWSVGLQHIIESIVKDVSAQAMHFKKSHKKK